MAASNGNLQILLNSGRVINLECYLPDAAGTMVSFSPTTLGVATDGTIFKLPENGRIVGFIHTTSPTAVGFEISLDNQEVLGGTVRYACNISSTVIRPQISIPFKAGQQLTIKQF